MLRKSEGDTRRVRGFTSLLPLDSKIRLSDAPLRCYRFGEHSRAVVGSLTDGDTVTSLAHLLKTIPGRGGRAIRRESSVRQCI